MGGAASDGRPESFYDVKQQHKETTTRDKYCPQHNQQLMEKPQKCVVVVAPFILLHTCNNSPLDFFKKLAEEEEEEEGRRPNPDKCRPSVTHQNLFPTIYLPLSIYLAITQKNHPTLVLLY
jgi:hypothetical protein